MSEYARVEVQVSGDNGIFCLRTLVNGCEPGSAVVHVPSIEEGDKASDEMAQVVRDVYRRAYRDGFSYAQSMIRGALGIRH